MTHLRVESKCQAGTILRTPHSLPPFPGRQPHRDSCYGLVTVHLLLALLLAYRLLGLPEALYLLMSPHLSIFCLLLFPMMLLPETYGWLLAPFSPLHPPLLSDFQPVLQTLSSRKQPSLTPLCTPGSAQGTGAVLTQSKSVSRVGRSQSVHTNNPTLSHSTFVVKRGEQRCHGASLACRQ